MKKRNTLHKTICLLLIVLIIIALTITACGPKLTPDQQLIQELKKDCSVTGNSSSYSIEEEILYKFLSRPNDNGSYVVVNLNTHFGIPFGNLTDSKLIMDRLRNIEESLNTDDYDTHLLMLKYLENNSKSHQLTIHSCINEGYYIDDVKFVMYLMKIEDDNNIKPEGEWGAYMHRYFPSFNGYLEVSMPAYDPETGYVLIYHGWQGGIVLGYGILHLMKYEDGKLHEINVRELWVS